MIYQELQALSLLWIPQLKSEVSQLFPSLLELGCLRQSWLTTHPLALQLIKFFAFVSSLVFPFLVSGNVTVIYGDFRRD